MLITTYYHLNTQNIYTVKDFIQQPRLLICDKKNRTNVGHQNQENFFYIEFFIEEVYNPIELSDDNSSKKRLKLLIYDPSNSNQSLKDPSDPDFRYLDDSELFEFSNTKEIEIYEDQIPKYTYGFSIRQTETEPNILIDYLQRTNNVAFKIECLVTIQNGVDKRFQSRALTLDFKGKKIRYFRKGKTDIPAKKKQTELEIYTSNSSVDFHSDIDSSEDLSSGNEIETLEDFSPNDNSEKKSKFLYKNWKIFLVLALGLAFCIVFTIFYLKKCRRFYENSQ
ncbi:hypothetical protein CDIK_1044 [Cucumispora dikerogammari]|nr:hypothetical protein CDIK_1044 [Cucumispora dikerogammari]